MLWDLNSLTRHWTRDLSSEAQSPNHLTAREFLRLLFFLNEKENKNQSMISSVKLLG